VGQGLLTAPIYPAPLYLKLSNDLSKSGCDKTVPAQGFQDRGQRLVVTPGLYKTYENYVADSYIGLFLTSIINNVFHRVRKVKRGVPLFRHLYG
jgi:hypothetical protein